MKTKLLAFLVLGIFVLGILMESIPAGPDDGSGGGKPPKLTFCSTSVIKGLSDGSGHRSQFIKQNIWVTKPNKFVKYSKGSKTGSPLKILSGKVLNSKIKSGPDDGDGGPG